MKYQKNFSSEFPRFYLLDYFDEVLEGRSPRAIDDHGSSQVTKNVRAHCLDSVQVAAEEKKQNLVMVFEYFH